MNLSKPKAIIDISQSAYKGTGVARFTIGLTKALNIYSKEFCWFFFFSSFRKKIPKELKEIKSLNLYKLPFPPILFETIWNKLHIIKPEYFLKDFKIWVSSDWVEPPIKNLKKATIIHDVIFLKYPETVHPRILKNQILRFKWIIKESSLVITDSLTTTNDLKELLKKKKIREILNISNIEVERFLNLPFTTIYPGVEKPKIIKKAEKILSKLSLTPKKYLLTVGKLEPRKNLNNLIKAFEHLNHPELKLVIVGPKGWAEIKTKNKNIVFPGFVEDDELYQLYKNAYAFISASIWEGFGYPLVESALLKTPVICSDIQIYKEITRGHAVFFDPKSIKRIKDAIDFSIKNPIILKKNAENFYESAKIYNWKNYVESFENELIKIL